MTTRSIWAIGDLHLSFGTPNKKMDLFGPIWKDHADALQESWDRLISPDDLVLIPGDISWAMRLDEAKADLQWIHERPGIKILIRGNHDYWWGSISKVRAALPPSIHVVQNDVFCVDSIAIGGTRYWESDDVDCSRLIAMKGEPGGLREERGDDEEILRREVGRLEASLRSMPKESTVKIAMTHYPPIGPDLAPTIASALFEQYGIQIVVFGHLHSFREGLGAVFGEARGVRYVLCSSDFLHFTPTKVM